MLYVSPEHSAADVAGELPGDDRPGASPDGGHGDHQVLRLQPAGRGVHTGTTQLALHQEPVRDTRLRHAGKAAINL